MSGSMLVKVGRVSTEAVDIKSFELKAADGGPLPPFSAGAHIDVQVPGAGTRQYSLCGDPGERHRYQIAVKNEPRSRGSSRALHLHVQTGDLLRIGSPRNQFGLAANASRHVLLAGGIGVTPMMSMVEQLRRDGASYHLHLFSRSDAHTPFVSRVRREEQDGHGSLYCGLEPDQVRSRLDELLFQPASGAHLYVCGPAPFMELVLALAHAGWPADAIHREHFLALARSAGMEDAAFSVRLARRGTSFQVPSGRSIVQVLREQGIDVETSCEEGICGTCETRVLEGIPLHRDSVLSPSQRNGGDRILPCVSRGRAGEVLVLDL